MSSGNASSLRPRDLLASWWQILAGRVPLLSIEITRECPLSCPGCYAYGDTHLSGGLTLRQLSDFRDDALVSGVIGLAKRHRPLHVSLVGGEPMMRRRELDRILPTLSDMGIFTMVKPEEFLQKNAASFPFLPNGTSFLASASPFPSMDFPSTTISAASPLLMNAF